MLVQKLDEKVVGTQGIGITPGGKGISDASPDGHKGEAPDTERKLIGKGGAAGEGAENA